MSSPFPDDVPVDDALEQRQTTADAVAEDELDGAAPPLESDTGDWQEQHQPVVDTDSDEDRR